MIKLLIADDHAVVREGIKRIVESAPEMRIIGEVSDGHELLKEISSEKLDILLLDISMPGLSFLELMHRLRAIVDKFRILILSIHPEEQYALRALKSGASGYLTKNHSPEELIAAIRHIHLGGRYISQSLGEQLAKQILTNEHDPQTYESLSDREYQIFCLLGKGVRTIDIGRKLSLSPKTITTYRSRIFEKMGFKNNAELILYAVKKGLVD